MNELGTIKLDTGARYDALKAAARERRRARREAQRATKQAQHETQEEKA